MTNDKSAEEIVRGLRNYQNLGDAPVGKCFGAIVPKSVIKDTADLIESQAAEIARLMERIAELEGQLAEYERRKEND